MTDWVPCPVLTSYTTTTACSECDCPDCGPTPPGPTETNCVPNSCTVSSANYIFVSSTPYSSDEIVPASVTINDVVDPTEIPASECTAYEPFTSEDVSYEGLPSCGCTTEALTCQASPCTSCVAGGYTSVYATSYASGQQADFVSGGATFTTPAQYCAVQTSASLYDQSEIDDAEVCGPGAFGGSDDDEDAGGGAGESVVTYTYYTNGATVVVATTYPSHGGPFHLVGTGGSRVDVANVYLVFWLWAVAGVISGTGMLVL